MCGVTGWDTNNFEWEGQLTSLHCYIIKIISYLLFPRNIPFISFLKDPLSICRSHSCWSWRNIAFWYAKNMEQYQKKIKICSYAFEGSLAVTLKRENAVFLLGKNDMSSFDCSEWQHPAMQKNQIGTALDTKKKKNERRCRCSTFRSSCHGAEGEIWWRDRKQLHLVFSTLEPRQNIIRIAIDPVEKEGRIHAPFFLL